MIKREESRHDFAFMAGVVIGAVAGALATLAFAPRAGAETRERWRARMDEMHVEQLKSRAAELREVAASKTEQLREKASAAGAGGVVESTRARVTELVDRSPLPVQLGEQPQPTPEEAADTLARVAEDAEERLRAEAEAAEGADQLLDEAAARAAAADETDQVQEERPDRSHEG